MVEAVLRLSRNVVRYPTVVSKGQGYADIHPLMAWPGQPDPKGHTLSGCLRALHADDYWPSSTPFAETGWTIAWGHIWLPEHHWASQPPQDCADVCFEVLGVAAGSMLTIEKRHMDPEQWPSCPECIQVWMLWAHAPVKSRPSSSLPLCKGLASTHHTNLGGSENLVLLSQFINESNARIQVNLLQTDSSLNDGHSQQECQQSAELSRWGMAPAIARLGLICSRWEEHV